MAGGEKRFRADVMPQGRLTLAEAMQNVANALPSGANAEQKEQVMTAVLLTFINRHEDLSDEQLSELLGKEGVTMPLDQLHGARSWLSARAEKAQAANAADEYDSGVASSGLREANSATRGRNVRSKRANQVKLQGDVYTGKLNLGDL